MPLNALTIPDATKCRSSGGNIRQQVETNGIFQITRIEIHEMVSSMGRNVVQEFFCQITMRIDETNTVAQLNVL